MRAVQTPLFIHRASSAVGVNSIDLACNDGARDAMINATVI
jgi:hypothetical protein